MHSVSVSTCKIPARGRSHTQVCFVLVQVLIVIGNLMRFIKMPFSIRNTVRSLTNDARSRRSPLLLLRTSEMSQLVVHYIRRLERHHCDSFNKP